jgi:hypothetical protein
LILRVGIDYALTRRYGFLGPCGGLIISESTLVLVWAGFLWLGDGFTLRIAAILWRPIAGCLVLGTLLYIAQPVSLPYLAGVLTIGGAIYLLSVLKLGAVSSVELELAREGMGFLPLFLRESRESRRKAL